MRRVLSLLLILAVTASLASCSRYKKYEYCEIGIYLDKNFEEYDSDGAFHVAYSDGSTIVGMTRFSFVDSEEYGLLSTYTPEQLAKVFMHKLSDVQTDGIKVHGDVPYFYYVATSTDGNQYFYMPTFYRTPYAYFVITFITPSVRAKEGRAEFLEYSSSVHILEEYL